MDIIKEIKNIIKKSRSTKSEGIINILLGFLFVLCAIQPPSLSNASKCLWMLSGVFFSMGITRLINAYYFKNFLKKLENENDQKNVAEKVAD